MSSGGSIEAVGTGHISPPDQIQWHILFRYSPAVGDRATLTLHYRSERMAGAGGREPRRATVRIRWSSDTDRVLVWETPPRPIRMSARSGWTPLPVGIPASPRGSTFLRFDIIVESGPDRIGWYTGFVQPGAALPDAGPDVMALCAVAGRGAERALPGPFAWPPVGGSAVGRTLPAWRLGEDGRGLLIVRVNPALRLSSLYVADWPGAGRTLLGARIPAPGSNGPTLLALPETGLRACQSRLLAVQADGRVSRARIRVASTPWAQGDDRPCHGCERQVAVVVTSCGRQDLMERTLDSLFAFNTYPLAQTIIVEDGPPEANARLMEKYAERNVTWLATGRRIGQIGAIDYAYAFVEQPYIFHVEDDWQFFNAGFIEKSLAILEARPDCLQVWIRALTDTNRHPLCEGLEFADAIPFRRVQGGYLGKWHGFSFNPGLRRTADYLRIGAYGWYVCYDPEQPDQSEWRLATVYKELGYYAAILADNAGKGYVRHLGFGRSVVERAAF